MITVANFSPSCKTGSEGGGPFGVVVTAFPTAASSSISSPTSHRRRFSSSSSRMLLPPSSIFSGFGLLGITNGIPRGGSSGVGGGSSSHERHPRQRRKNPVDVDDDDPVTSSPYNENYEPPIYNKTKEERELLLESITANFMFQDLPEDVLEKVVLAFELVPREKTLPGSIIFKQGDTSNQYMYIVAEGECSVLIDGKTIAEPFGTIKKGSIVGELAILYDSPRAATVKVKDDMRYRYNNMNTNNRYANGYGRYSHRYRSLNTNINNINGASAGAKLYQLDKKSFLHFMKTKETKDVADDDTATTASPSNATTASGAATTTRTTATTTRTAGTNPVASEDVKKELKSIDRMIDQISGVKTRYEDGSIIRQYRPQRSWLWRQWSGTIVSHAWKSTVSKMVLTLFIALYVKYGLNVGHIGLSTPPDPSLHPFIGNLNLFSRVWKYMLSVTTFILTFFLSQAYGLWRTMYDSARNIQGKMSDISLLLATFAKRDYYYNTDGSGGGSSEITREGEMLIDDIASMQRLLGVFCWARFSKPYQVLITPRGLSRMLSRGLLSRTQYQLLLGLDPNVGFHNAIVAWMTTRINRALHPPPPPPATPPTSPVSGDQEQEPQQQVQQSSVDKTRTSPSLVKSDALEFMLLSKLCELRGVVAGISGILDGRMPMAYVHIVQVLVDTFLFTAPFALYVECGLWSVLAVGLLSLFYNGLLDLAKILLDPLDNDDLYVDSENMDIGVLIREMNAGSTRFKYACETLPFQM